MDYSKKGRWEREKSICSGCHREVTNRAYFAGAHMRGKCQRDKGFKVPRPLWTQALPHPSRAVLNRAYTDDEPLAAKYKDWRITKEGYGLFAFRLPETYSELCQWWHLKPMGG